MTDEKFLENAVQDAKETQRVRNILESGDSLGLSIDTNFYIRAGGGSLDVPFRKKLIDYNRRFQHLCPSVWEREIKKHLAGSVNKAIDKANSISAAHIAILGCSEVNSANKTLKDTTNKIDTQRLVSEIWDKFVAETDMIRVQTPAESANIVLDWYFEPRLPFEGSGNKKNEFPDAFALHSLSKYAEQNCIKAVIVVTKDKGAYGHCQTVPNLIPFQDIQSALGAFDTKEYIEKRRQLSEIVSESIAIENLRQTFVECINAPYRHQVQAWPAITKPDFPQNSRFIIEEILKFELIPSGNFQLPIIITSFSEDNQEGSDSYVDLQISMKVNICAKVSCEISAIDTDNPNNKKLRQKFVLDNSIESEGFLNLSISLKKHRQASIESTLRNIDYKQTSFDFLVAEIEPNQVSVPRNFVYSPFA